MPKKKDEENEAGVLVTAAKTIGKLAGKITAKTVGPHAEAGAEPQNRTRRGKLPPKNKARLPRKMKKRERKTAASDL